MVVTLIDAKIIIISGASRCAVNKIISLQFEATILSLDPPSTPLSSSNPLYPISSSTLLFPFNHSYCLLTYPFYSSLSTVFPSIHSLSSDSKATSLSCPDSIITLSYPKQFPALLTIHSTSPSTMPSNSISLKFSTCLNACFLAKGLTKFFLFFSS